MPVRGSVERRTVCQGSRLKVIGRHFALTGFLLGVLPWTPWVFGTATVGLTILPVVYARRAGGPTIAATGVIAAIVQLSGIAVQPVAGRLGRAGRARTPFLGLLLATVGLAACGLSGAAPVVLVSVAAVTLGASYGTLLVFGLRQVERQANADETARLVALFYVPTYIGFGGVPYVAAMFAGSHGYTWPLLIAALIALLTAPLAAAAARRPRPSSPRPPGGYDRWSDQPAAGTSPVAHRSCPALSPCSRAEAESARTSHPSHEFGGDMTSTSVSRIVPASPERVWDLIGGFHALPDWLPFISESIPLEDGRSRRLRTPDGGVVIERMESFSEQERRCTYSIVEAPFPVTDCIVTLSVHGLPGREDGAEVVWSARFVPDGVSDAEAVELFNGLYRDGLEALNQAFAE